MAVRAKRNHVQSERASSVQISVPRESSCGEKSLWQEIGGMTDGFVGKWRLGRRPTSGTAAAKHGRLVGRGKARGRPCVAGAKREAALRIEAQPGWMGALGAMRPRRSVEATDERGAPLGRTSHRIERRRAGAARVFAARIERRARWHPSEGWSRAMAEESDSIGM